MFGITSFLSGKAGVPEPVLRLFITLILGYPIALAHRCFFFGKPPALQHVYFIACGFTLGMYNFGMDMLHTTFSILAVYAVLKTIGGTVHSVVITLLFTLGYLIAGYINTSTDTYDIVWTMPFCVLVLRLTGLAFDIYDGSLQEEELSKDSKKLALREVPSLIEIAAFAYFPTTFIVGPQFPMRKYQDFVAGKLKPLNQEKPMCIQPAVKTLLLAVLYAVIHSIGVSNYSSDYILSKEFEDRPFINRIIDLGIWAHVQLQKYIGCWLFTEGSCILIGLAYNGEDKDGNPKWDGCSNVDILLFEKAQNFHYDYIASFNTNTNFWMLQYVYKRLKFLGNKYLSQIGVLLFLATWHGLHSGYYVCFLMEFFAVYMEKEFAEILYKNEKFLTIVNYPLLKPFVWIFLKFYTIVFMGPCMAPLSLLSFDKYWRVYKQVYFFHFFWMFWPLYKPLVKMLLPPKRLRVD